MNATHWGRLIVILAGRLLMPVIGVRAQDAGEADKAKLEKAFPGKPNYSPYAGRNFPTRPLFGDTHLHTSFSMDVGAFGAASGGVAWVVGSSPKIWAHPPSTSSVGARHHMSPP